jgi:hypothetical protein
MNHFGEFVTFRIILVRFHKITFFTLRIHLDSDFRTLQNYHELFYFILFGEFNHPWSHLGSSHTG